MLPITLHVHVLYSIPYCQVVIVDDPNMPKSFEVNNDSEASPKESCVHGYVLNHVMIMMESESQKQSSKSLCLMNVFVKVLFVHSTCRLYM